ncbi:MAG: hypothetical protein WBA88_13520 [Pseudaminobacter sp.]
MTSLALTAHSLSLLGKPRARQTVHRVVSVFGGGNPARHIVLVVPDGAETGEYYEVSDRTLAALHDGASPEYLGLEPCDDGYPDDYAGTAWDRDASAGDARHQFNREQEQF